MRVCSNVTPPYLLPTEYQTRREGRHEQFQLHNLSSRRRLRNVPLPANLTDASHCDGLNARERFFGQLFKLTNLEGKAVLRPAEGNFQEMKFDLKFWGVAVYHYLGSLIKPQFESTQFLYFKSYLPKHHYSRVSNTCLLKPCRNWEEYLVDLAPLTHVKLVGTEAPACEVHGFVQSWPYKRADLTSRLLTSLTVFISRR